MSEYLSGLAEQALGGSVPGRVQPRPVHAFERRAAPSPVEEWPPEAPVETDRNRPPPLPPVPEPRAEVPTRTPPEAEVPGPVRHRSEPANGPRPSPRPQPSQPEAPPAPTRVPAEQTVPPPASRPGTGEFDPPIPVSRRSSEDSAIRPPKRPRPVAPARPGTAVVTPPPRAGTLLVTAVRVRPSPQPVLVPEAPVVPVPPSVQVTIGRLEVRLTGGVLPAVRTAPAPPTTLSLDDYLQGRDGKRR